MNEKEIYWKLNQHLKIVQQNYPTENIIVICATKIGDDEIESSAIVVPTFEQVCTSLQSIHTTLCKYITIYDIREMYNIKQYFIFDAEYIIINPKYEHIFYKVCMANKDKFNAGGAIGKPANECRIALMKICRYCWNEGSNAVRFIKQITDAEKLALNGIVKIIGDEGIISQSKVASSVGVSRLTMSNLIMKMQFCEVATVKYMGNKGTYIKIIDDTLLNINGESIRM